jgi:hypothetical protein
MNHIRLFNPENDIMLQWPTRRSAVGSHTLSAPVRALHRAGAMLPVWWADAGDAVVVDADSREACSAWLADMAKLFPRLSDVGIADAGDAGKFGAPWGWSGDAARQLSAVGAVCPDEAALERMRMLSHRRTSIAVMERLAMAMPDVQFPQSAVEVRSVDELTDVARQIGGAFYLKAPWSSSGRGVVRFDALMPKAVERAQGAIRRQGSVMVERALDAIQDFAMLFYIDNGIVEWRGYSLFFNAHASTSYGGNLLCDDTGIERRLADMGADATLLHRIASALTDIFTDLIADAYTGWLGVDMLLTRDGVIAPCVEVNLRMTMGVVAHVLTERFLAPGVEAVYSVEPRRADEKVPAPVIEAGRLVDGTLMLTPPSAFAFKISVAER